MIYSYCSPKEVFDIKVHSGTIIHQSYMEIAIYLNFVYVSHNFALKLLYLAHPGDKSGYFLYYILILRKTFFTTRLVKLIFFRQPSRSMWINRVPCFPLSQKTFFGLFQPASNFFLGGGNSKLCFLKWLSSKELLSKSSPCVYYFKWKCFFTCVLLVSF